MILVTAQSQILRSRNGQGFFQIYAGGRLAVTDLCRNFLVNTGQKPRFFRDFEARV